MTRFDYDDEDVVVVVGSGAGGGTVAHELTRRGIKVVVLEAGPHLTGPDYHQDEWASFEQMAWTDPRTATGSWRITEDFPNLPAWIVKAVGGSTTHWAGACPRFKAHELAARSAYGDVEGATLLDWPISLSELEPYYDKAEMTMGVSHRHGRPPMPANNNYKVLANGAAKRGYKKISTGPYATNVEPYDGRPGTTQDGFNFQGDKQGSKWSTLVAALTKAEETGHLDLRPECHAAQILHDASGRATGVVYVDRNGTLRRQSAAVVCVAGNSIETPRLLLLSGSAQHPDGLANSSGEVGRNYMRHTTGTIWGQFDNPVHMYRGETMAGVVGDQSGHEPERGFVGGYYLETISLGPAFLAKFMAPGKWGTAVTELLDQYRNTAGMWIVGEDMPCAENRITLSGDVVDANQLPVASVHFDDHPNDEAMRNHAYREGAAIYEAVGAHRTIETPPYPSTHNLGTCRMSQRPSEGVVDRYGRAHDVPNLFVSDGSVFTTGAAANPTLTIVALAIRQAEFIATELSKTLEGASA